MKRFAAVANAGASHQMTMCAIGRELQKRGHDFLLLGTGFQSKQLRLPDIRFQIVGDGGRDPAQRYFERARNQESLPISATIEYMKGIAALWCGEVPAILRERQIDFVLADQEEPGAAAAADIAGLPYASICSSLPLNESPGIPPGFLGWRYAPGFFGQLRNRVGYTIRNAVVHGVHGAINAYRRAAGLRPYRRPDDSFSTRAQISQLAKEFDFPRAVLPVAFHYVGPFQRQALAQVDFPFDRLNGKPLIYASFGTSFGSRQRELQAIAEACATLPVQLVISLGGSASGSEYEFSGHPLVVRYAPQRDLLARCALAITHAGLNTTMEALSLGTPLLAMPIAGDQLGVASRIAYHGAGLVLDQRERSVERIRQAISALLDDRRWRDSAKRLQEAIGRTGGSAEAAEIIEGVVMTDKSRTANL